MRPLALLLLLALGGSGLAQDDLTVLKQDAENPPQKMLYNFLQKEAQKKFEERRKTVAALKSPEEIVQRQKDLRAKFIASLGGFPEKTPLNPRITGTAQRDGYRIEKIIYESRPNHHVTAVMYLPDGQPPFPGVLVPCGHSVNGKAAEAYQRVCILMAKNGLAVLCYDPIGQGERIQLLTKEGKPAIAGSTSEHTMAGIGALLVGRNTASYRIWDGIRSLDYLASRPEVDPKRLGCTGNSGGGTLTAYLMALDDRIVAAAPSCYITSLERLFATIGPQDAEQNITGQVAFGMEHSDYVTMRAPRPTLLCVGTQDYFDIQGAWTTFREAKLLYGMLGHGERVDLFEYNDKHGFSKPRREAAMRWMRRWLLSKDDAPFEGDFRILKDEELQCTRTGQVLEDLKGKSVFDLNAEREFELSMQRKQGDARQDPRPKIRELLNLDLDRANRKLATRTNDRGQTAIQRDGYTIRKFAFETEPGILIPTLHFEPAGGPAQEVVVYVHGEGKAVDAAPGGPIEKLVRGGKSVFALDLRGMGETAPGKTTPNRPAFFGTDSKEAFLSLHLNRPLLGPRVVDVVSIITSLLQEQPQRKFHLVGIQSAGPVVLHTAVVFNGEWLKSVTLEKSLESWSDVVRNPISVDQLTNVVPGVLQHYDLPDLVALLKPLPVTVRNPVDGANRPITNR